MSDNEKHIGLVYRVAQELANTNETCIRAFGRDVKDYLGEGFLALQVAKKGYKKELGFKFSTYAMEVIRDRIIQAARRSSLIKVSFQARYEASRALAGKEIDPKNESKVKAALKVMQGHCTTLAPDAISEEVETPAWEMNEELYARLHTLDERTRQVIVMRFGLDGEEPMTLEEVGEKMTPPITRERVRQIEKAGLTKLKETLQF